MLCENFCNSHCEYDCPNIQIDMFEERYDLPASEIGLERITCKNCQFNIKYCDCNDCYLKNSKDCHGTRDNE